MPQVRRFLIVTSSLAAVPALLWAAPGCTDVIEGDTHNHYYSFGGAGEGPATGGTSSEEGYTSHLPDCPQKVDLSGLDLDPFEQDGHRFYFEITPEARANGDAQICSYGTDFFGSVYRLDDQGGACPIPAINVRVLPAGTSLCADTGKVEVDLPGQSSFRPWLEIPNIKLDLGEFEVLKFKSGDRILRFNNGQADSTIVREAVALGIWRAMGYPAPKTRFAQTQSNVWDTEIRPGVKASHVMVQTYKEAFFSQSLPEVRHVWEGYGDPFIQWGNECDLWGCCDEWGCEGEGELADAVDAQPAPGMDVPAPGGPDEPVGRGSFSGECQWSVDEDCSEEAFDRIIAGVTAAPQGPGFMAATAEYIDWPRLHQNQCLSALTGTGDDWIHNTNNVVLAILESGKAIFLPYSTDISGDHPWYQSTPYTGIATLTQSCQGDPDCWEMALSTCEAMIDEFEDLDVSERIVDERCEALVNAGLDRKPDAAVCESLVDFYDRRPASLREELDSLRSGDGGFGGAGPVEPPEELE